MKKNYNRIISEYRDADCNRRLHMYLQLPDQRSDFNAIEQNEQKHEYSSGFKLRRHSSVAQISVLFTAALGFAKKLLT